MKKYLGSVMTAYAAVIAPFFVIVPILFSVIILCTAEISGAVVFLVCLFFSCSVIWSIYIKKELLQLYAWGSFEGNCVKVHCPFIQEFVLDFDKCVAVGIGSYTHGVLNSRCGSKLYFIYLSYDYLDAKCIEKINFWKPSTRGIKVQFDYKLYKWLLSNLPQKQSKMLEQSYKNSSLSI